MKNVIALGLVACAALNVNAMAGDNQLKAEDVTVEVVKEWINSECEMELNDTFWNTKATSSEEIVAYREKQTKHYMQAGMHKGAAERKAQDDVQVILDKDLDMFQLEQAQCLAKRMLDTKYVMEYKARLIKDLKESEAQQEQFAREAAEEEAKAKAAQEAKAKAAVKNYYIMDVLTNPALKRQLSQCEATPDAARVIAQIKRESQEARVQYQQEVQFLRDNGYDGMAAAKQASKTILDPANENAKFNTERADKFVNKCLSQNYGWTFHN